MATFNRGHLLHTDTDEWMLSGIEATFVHVATAAHGKVIRSLLGRGISVYVDKPISDDMDEVKQLIELAGSKGLLLTAGFNRRFAPMIRRLQEIPEKNMLFIRKDRINLIEPVRHVVYDLFLHLADAGLYLLDEEVLSVQSKIIEQDGNLKRIWVELETNSASCFVSMNYAAGANQEVMEVQSPEGIVRVVDLTDMATSDQAGTQLAGFGDWEGTLRKRGFEPLIRGFIEGVTNKENPVTTESAYLSHSLCEKILQDNGY